ncbi:MAG: hypothetical protein P8H57_09780 [Emcibacteraceae bacterium]|nr:hypothetical protein [Emcibacteraceae bacterium]MDG1727428.1 hypothetical protein [Emcibacteraceae bacterium]
MLEISILEKAVDNASAVVASSAITVTDAYKLGLNPVSGLKR